MKLKSLVKYQIWDGSKGLAVFYLVVVTLVIVSALSVNMNVNGIEFASSIFIFIAGIASFKDIFKYGLANGLSRKTIFLSFILSIFPFAAIMALVDTLLRLLTGFESIFFALYGARYVNINSFIAIFEGFFWMVLLYVMFAGIGYFISLIYYRSNKLMKLIVSIVPPVVTFILLPMLGVFNNIVKLVVMFFGRYNTVNPYISMASCLVTFVALAMLSFLLIRKAPIKR